ncbi:MAG: exodeoxyribonuclease VII large subunit [Acidobacteria bacterium]|nr:exodeoxyribonuclease VII large subunit [Acidobacteriota bacterium]
MSQLPFDDEPEKPPTALPTTSKPRAFTEPRQAVEPRRSTAAPTPTRETAVTPSRGTEPERRRAVLSVSELSARLRGLLETTFIDVWVEGEISNGRAWNSGHYYFTLKDAGAQIKGVLFRNTLRLLRFTPEDGLRVVARGRISVYEPKGEYQFVCEHMEPQGYGPLQLAYEQLRKKLAAEGLFDEARKRPLPTLPRRIGIVTSIDGAALRDIVRVLRRRYPNAHLVIAPTRVQGEGAAGEVARALRFIARVDDVDVVIVGRGGGSLEDLWAFNEEAVARAIAACPIPVISAVGHETDVTIADFVADLRAPTPSAAAEMVVRKKDEFTAHIDRLAGRLDSCVQMRIRRHESRLHALDARPAFAGYRARLAWRSRHVAELSTDLGAKMRTGLTTRQRRVDTLARTLASFDPRHRLGRIRATLLTLEGRLGAAAARRQHAADGRFRAIAARLEGLSPLAVLGRGYAVCWDADNNRIVRDASAVAPGQAIRVTLERGELHARVSTPPLDPALQ